MAPYADRHPIRGQDLASLAQGLLNGRPLIVASNRGPIQYSLDRDGQLRQQRGSGGVVTALSSLCEHVPMTWVACALSEADRRQAGSESPVLGLFDDKLSLRFVSVPIRTFRKYYFTIANPLLWFLQHYMLDPAYQPEIDHVVYDAWENGYLRVNEAFAATICREASRLGGKPVVMLHDYHLYPLARMVRRGLGDVVIQHFVHIPWPEPDYWHLLPDGMRRIIFDGLLANDIVGFQTNRAVDNFLNGCRVFLRGEVQVQRSAATVRSGDHLTRVRAYPISIDVAGLLDTMTTRSAVRHQRVLREKLGQQTIVRVDRAEPSKNIVRGFRAFDVLLRRHRDLRERVKFMAFLVPSRTSVPEYRRYQEEIWRTVAATNERHGTARWQPIEVFYENNYVQALAGMSLYDVLLVNPIIDGMNLVAKEGPTVNTRHGVLVLSEGAGAFEQLQDGALAVTPTDIEGTARALYQALKMPADERERRARLLQAEVAEHDVGWWLRQQFEDLLSVGRHLDEPPPSPVAQSYVASVP
jgi:trehalose 6-phosphate synthase